MQTSKVPTPVPDHMKGITQPKSPPPPPKKPPYLLGDDMSITELREMIIGLKRDIKSIYSFQTDLLKRIQAIEEAHKSSIDEQCTSFECENQQSAAIAADFIHGDTIASEEIAADPPKTTRPTKKGKIARGSE